MSKKKNKKRRAKVISTTKVKAENSQNTAKSEGYRIFIIGAGFSVPAKLPQGNDLFALIREKIADTLTFNNHFEKALDGYITFVEKSQGKLLKKDDVNLEDFISYLDIDHYLGLSEIQSKNGNNAQMLAKEFIGKVLHEKTPQADDLPDCYIEFANSLTTNDIIITLNYDVILERALEKIKKPYRLFPDRYSEIGVLSSTVDGTNEQVVILKLHGSLDWFDKTEYIEITEMRKIASGAGPAKNPVFNPSSTYDAKAIVDGPRPTSDPLSNIYRINKPDDFYSNMNPPYTPMILSPSAMKILYAGPLKGFFNRLGDAGVFNLGIAIIGFSLPDHDQYLKIMLYNMISNYQNTNWDGELLGTKKDNVKIVDYSPAELKKEKEEALKSTYQFIDNSKAEYYLDGFSVDAVKFLFKNSRT